MENEINLKVFAEAVYQKRDRMRISLRELADEINISSSTLSRLERGNLPDINTYMKLCDWLGNSPSDFLNKTIEKSNNPITSHNDVILFLASDARLGALVSHALITMIEIAYSNARISQPLT